MQGRTFFLESPRDKRSLCSIVTSLLLLPFKGLRRTPNAKTHAEEAAKAYSKTAGLFCLIMLLTWGPASANRWYSMAHPGHISVPLTYASAIFLPLQGFFNAVIFFYCSRKPTNELLRKLKAKICNRRREVTHQQQWPSISMRDLLPRTYPTTTHFSNDSPNLPYPEATHFGNSRNGDSVVNFEQMFREEEDLNSPRMKNIGRAL